MLAAIDWESVIVDPIREMLSRIMGYLPVLLGALIIFVVGWMIAKAIRWTVDRTLKAVHFDTLADKSGISGFLKKGDIKTTPRGLMSGLFYWLVMVMVLVMVVSALGLPNASDVLGMLFAYIPRVIAALFILVAGMFLASFVARIVQVAAANADLPKAELFAGISRWTIVIFASAVALSQLGIAPLFVTGSFNIILGGVCLALAIAIGLGSKDTVSRYLEEWHNHRMETHKYQKQH